MTFQTRAERWPSAWQLVLHSGSGPDSDMVVEIRNISATGCQYVAGESLPMGTAVMFIVGQDEVQGSIVRCDPLGGAISFDQWLTTHQISNLRQFRRLRGTRPTDAEIDAAVSNIMNGI